MHSPIETVSSLVIGSVESVSPSRIEVLLELNAPQATAINTGVPNGFPRINGYVLIPNETGAVVGLVVWIGIERSAFPKRTGMKDFGLIDLPFPLRKLYLTPLGTLVCNKKQRDGSYQYSLERGVAAFPSVGDPVLLPTLKQLHSIVESDGNDCRVKIGTSPLAADAVVSVDPDKLFGRHLAVLGNTGSGKSCSVAGLIRWSLEKAKEERLRLEKTGPPNARFIILDPNGEYAKTFEDFGSNVRRFMVPPVNKNFKPLQLPAWIWDSQEWSAFAHAAPQVQRPLLRRAIREMRAGHALNEPIAIRVVRQLNFWLNRVRQFIGEGPSTYADTPAARFACGDFIKDIHEDANNLSQEDIDDGVKAGLAKLSADAMDVIVARKDGKYYRRFQLTDLKLIENTMQGILKLFPNMNSTPVPNVDSPIFFNVRDLPGYLEMLAAQSGNSNASQFISSLVIRIESMLSDPKFGAVVSASQDQVTLSEWLDNYIGDDNANTGQVTVIDLSLVPSEIIHVVVAVIARIIFEASQRYRRHYNEELPTVLVLEEAHTFIHRSSTDNDDILTASDMCRRIFERIAREGRKFGLGLVLSSQRPSELSQTVLAQCNTFLLHRIVNDKDQELVGKLIPDNLGGLLKDLPSLPSKQAILLGWAAQIPTLVEITELPEHQRPHSADPNFWSVWTGEQGRAIDWEIIAQEWTGHNPTAKTTEAQMTTTNQGDDLPL